MNIDKNNYAEETELDTNPSLTLARTLTLSIGERNFDNFTSSLVTTPRFFILRIWIYQKIWGAIQSLDQNRFEAKNHNWMKLTPKEQILRK